MSDKLRAAAKAVGDAKNILFLREMSVHDKVYLRLEDAINALEAALAEPAIKESLTASEQEPVACIGTNGKLMWLKKPSTIYSKPRFLYAAATPRREFVGLTDEEIYVEAEKEEQAHGFILGAMWAETKLREKNT